MCVGVAEGGVRPAQIKRFTVEVGIIVLCANKDHIGKRIIRADACETAAGIGVVTETASAGGDVCFRIGKGVTALGIIQRAVESVA